MQAGAGLCFAVTRPWVCLVWVVGERDGAGETGEQECPCRVQEVTWALGGTGGTSCIPCPSCSIVMRSLARRPGHCKQSSQHCVHSAPAQSFPTRLGPSSCAVPLPQRPAMQPVPELLVLELLASQSPRRGQEDARGGEGPGGERQCPFLLPAMQTETEKDQIPKFLFKPGRRSPGWRRRDRPLREGRAALVRVWQGPVCSEGPGSGAV